MIDPLMKKQRWTMRALAKSAGTSTSVLSEWADHDHMPRFEVVSRVAELLGLQLFRWDAIPEGLDALVRLDAERAELLRRYDEDLGFRKAVQELLKGEWRETG